MDPNRERYNSNIAALSSLAEGGLKSNERSSEGEESRTRTPDMVREQRTTDESLDGTNQEGDDDGDENGVKCIKCEKLFPDIIV